MATPWHALSPDEALARLGATPDGLSAEESARRLSLHGPNRVEHGDGVPVLRILVDQFRSLVVLLLVAASAVSLVLGDRVEAAAIGAVLAINATLGFVLELRARRAMRALLRGTVQTATVVRAGRPEQVPAERLVPGDVIAVAEGQTVPADARLLTATELRASEAMLTGESVPVDKDASLPVDAEAVLAERPSMLHSGTNVTAGIGRALVVRTGAETEVGRIGVLVAEVEQSRTPLEVRLDELGRRLVWLTLAVAVAVTVLGALRGLPLGLMIETGIALAIAAVPEGLPAVATIALAVGLRRMARRHALVRRLAAVEALGATTVVCTDKTGTLTAGQMTVTAIATPERSVSVSGRGYAPQGELVEGGIGIDAPDAWLGRLLEACALTSRATLRPGQDGPLGDPTDAALLVLAIKGGVDPERLRADAPLLDELPFSSVRLSSSSLHDRGGDAVTYVKGAPATVMAECGSWATRTGDRTLGSQDRRAFEDANERLAASGLRVIALAEGPARAKGSEPALTLLGLVGIVDPPAQGVGEALQALRAAGIRTVMVTGDQGATGRAIAHDLGMMDEGATAIDGREISRLSRDELEARMGTAGVLSRVSPEDKVRIVAALQARGEVVAMIGDGVNDAAALKKADIGVAMGDRGTDVAKQTAAIVLTDDRFTTIAAAVEEGRVIFDNIRKFVFYLFSCNLAEVLVVLGASVVGAPLPLLPLQILWLNLVTDTFPALALAMEPAEPGVMTRPPRPPGSAILSRRFVSAILLYAAVITAVTLVAYGWAIASGVPERARTIAFMTLGLAQLFHLGTARGRHQVVSPRRALANHWALAAVPTVVALQLLAVYAAPLATILGTTPLARTDLLICVGLSLVPALVGQGLRLARRTPP